jgi:hypothetical protein
LNEQQETSLENIKLNDNFWKWFGNSEVIGKDRSPIICYHGTDKEFNVFKPSKYGAMGAGIYLTTYKEIAAMHGKYVMEVFVKLESDSDGIIAGHEIIMKKPQNIKSINNDGTWDIDDQNIYS